MTKVLVVDDDPMVRTGLSMILGGAPDLELVGEATNGQEAIDGVRRFSPDVVLMDIRMPAGARRALSRHGNPRRRCAAAGDHADDL